MSTTTNETDSLFVFIAAVLVFFMHTGFAMLECGGVQPKNRQSILIKNVMLVATSCLSWWILGYTLASSCASGDENGFMGTDFSTNSFLQDSALLTGNGLINWFFGFAFAATAATIVSGAVAERTHFHAYIVYSAVLTAFVYPVVAYWGWNSEGFLIKGGTDGDGTNGYVDFAGSGLVHMVGGCAGLVGAYLVGPRKYMNSADGSFIPRFEEDGTVNQPDMGASSIAFSTLGTLILWVGWYGFNPGSAFGITGSNLDVVGLAVVNTTMGPASSAFAYFLFSFFMRKEGSDLTGILNSALGGLVSVTANCHCIWPWAAFVIGTIAAFVYMGSSYLLKYLKIDDVIDASPVHYFCGMWGVLATGLFGSDHFLGSHDAGLFYGGGKMLGWQLVGIICITAWTAGVTALFMAPMNYMNMLRISEEEEKLGLDKMMEQSNYHTVTTPKYSTSTTLKKPTLSMDVETGKDATAHVGLDVVVPEADAEVAAPESTANGDRNCTTSC